MEQVRTLRSYVGELGAEMAKKEAANRAMKPSLTGNETNNREIKRHHEIKIRIKRSSACALYCVQRENILKSSKSLSHAKRNRKN